MKSVRFRSFSGPYFPAFGLNTERYGVKYRPEKLRIQTLFTQYHSIKEGTVSRNIFRIALIALEEMEVCRCVNKPT